MICFDTNLLIFGLQRKSSPRQVSEMEAAIHYINSLTNTDDIIIPPVVVMEYLQGFPDPRDRAAQYEDLASSFFIPSFDAHAAKIAADISISFGKFKPICEVTGLSKPELRGDIQVIATALANEAETIITFNQKEYQTILTTAGLEKRIRVKWVAPVVQPLLLSGEARDKDSLN